MILALLALTLSAVLLFGNALVNRAHGSRGVRFGDAGTVETFIPEIWSAKLLSAAKRASVFAAPAVVNRDYEGEIANVGDTVRINTIGDPTIGDYVPNSTDVEPEVLDTADQTLTVDQAKYFAFKVDDVDKAQTAGNVMAEAMDRSGYLLQQKADLYVASLYAGADAGNIVDVSSAEPTNRATALAVLSKLMVTLDEADVPDIGRYAIVPPWFAGLIVTPDSSVALLTTDDSPSLTNGLVTRRFGFDLYKSNNCPAVDGTHNTVVAGTNAAISYADQINKTEAYRIEKGFGDGVKGLHVYGAKLTRPTFVASASCLIPT